MKLKMTSLNCLANEGIVAGLWTLLPIPQDFWQQDSREHLHIQRWAFIILHITYIFYPSANYKRFISGGSIFRDNNWQLVWKTCSLLYVGRELIWDRGYILTKLRSSSPQGFITTFILKHQVGRHLCH